METGGGIIVISPKGKERGDIYILFLIVNTGKEDMKAYRVENFISKIER